MADQNTNKAPVVDANLVNPLDVRNIQQTSDGSSIIKSIVSTETSKGPENILGEAPKMDTSLLKDFVPKKSIFLFALKIIFTILVFLSIAAILFFTSQLTSRLDFFTDSVKIPSAVKSLASTNSEVVSLQTDTNVYKYLQIKSLLDKFSYDGDAYIRNYDVSLSQTATDSDRSAASGRLENIRAALRTSFLAAKELAAEPIYVPIIDLQYTDDSSLMLFFRERLQTKLAEKAGVLNNGENAESRRDYRNYVNAGTLVNNPKLVSLLVQSDFDAMTEAELYNLVKNVNTLVVNDMSIIQQIKNERIKWSDIINEIELRTKTIDAHYSKNYYETVGGIRYTSFDFDSENKRISIIGETKTINTATFTMIADLIDELNRSSLFKDGEMRSFSKSGSLTEGYSGSLRLSLNLEDNIIVTND